ncbi:ARM-repeat/Tetratricopeptide repeat (TPR)-likeprotein [Striga asiatica]|uniref:ARM-repeat/Tetratricopeptide repeat (TPR)-likeprotein n=1 Tax=Striga asiatica TaxID=4170 RepID=A0A5A7RH34_STRAF|nr:ARM-repeat/Tetratricopeptide repeat (TPR)-likeprotein [Striga asiatica]
MEVKVLLDICVVGKKLVEGGRTVPRYGFVSMEKGAFDWISDMFGANGDELDGKDIFFSCTLPNAALLKFFRDVPSQDDNGQVLPINSLWNTAMAHLNDPEFTDLRNLQLQVGPHLQGPPKPPLASP